jgi:hypothetical protein
MTQERITILFSFIPLLYLFHPNLFTLRRVKLSVGPRCPGCNPIVFLSTYRFSRLIWWLKYLFGSWNIYGCTRAAVYQILSLWVSAPSQGTSDQPPRKAPVYMINTSWCPNCDVKWCIRSDRPICIYLFPYCNTIFFRRHFRMMNDF